jgi:hypothetical protein
LYDYFLQGTLMQYSQELLTVSESTEMKPL